MKTLESELVGILREIDAEQDEGGIYALPDRYSTGKMPAPHHHLFGGGIDPIDLSMRLGLNRGRKWRKTIEFDHDDKVCSLRFIDIATTKVRSYGNGHQLDTHHGKKWEDRSSELMDGVLGLVKEVKRGRTRCDRYLLLALLFTDTDKHAQQTYSSATEPDFITRYHLSLAFDTWPDPHGRRMWTTAICWSIPAPDAI